MDVEKWMVQIRKGALDLIILNILRAGALYGLEMIQRLEKIPELNLTEGTLYPLLGRLLRDELVFAEWIESDQGRPRKYYSLTEKGRRMLKDLNEAWAAYTKSIQHIIER